MQADFLTELRKIDKSSEIYMELADYCEESDKYQEKLLMLEQLGF